MPETELTLPDRRTVTLWRTADQAQPDNLQAWDAADAYVLQHVAETPVTGDRWLISGDRFGALMVGLDAHAPTWWGDSVLAHAAALANLAGNGLDGGPAERWRPLPQTPPAADVVVVKVPRARARLEDVLARLAPQLPEGAQVIGAGMTRHVHTSTVEAFQRLIGPTITTQARKKARLILSTADGRASGAVPAPETFQIEGVTVVTRPGVFSAGRLDEGTRLLLDVLPVGAGPLDMIDLGCGSGVIGTVIAVRNPAAAVTFTDVSHTAVASAGDTWRANHGDRPATFLAADSLAACEDGSADLVVVNPPFHQGHEEGDAVAWAMFSEARPVLRRGGRIAVVGNRHLAYHAKLARLFGNVRVLGSDARYVVLSSVRG